MSTNLVFLYVTIFICCGFSSESYSQRESQGHEHTDPVREGFVQTGNRYEGVNLTEAEASYLAKLGEKYKITDKERKLRRSFKDTLNLIERIKLARSYKKENTKVKKILEFRKKKIEGMQTKDALKRMHERENRAKDTYKKRKREARKRKFKNLFK
ncbi:MAG: hypothetical protein B6I20_08250 [Bacteroidetes bacterium 4572_117]|nr:MAG: hypothetical protein B6I20_08250 [Bacteroidetes bacterium 4572_117]